MNKQWYSIINKSDRAEIWIYEEIGEDWFSGGGVTAKGFQKELSAIKANQIDLHVNSPGGEVFDGLTIHNLIKQHPAKVTTYVDGLAASIASVIALAGDKIVMAENALMMIHNPYGMTRGDAAEMRRMADTLDKVSGSIVLAYANKTGKTDEEIKSMMDAETWMTADEAMNYGFIDEISEQMDMAASIKFAPIMAKVGFKNIPENIATKKKQLTARDLEDALREKGCPEAMAKSILANGYRGEQREVALPAEQREVAAPVIAKKDRVADLLTRAEIVAPSH